MNARVEQALGELSRRRGLALAVEPEQPWDEPKILEHLVTRYGMARPDAALIASAARPEHALEVLDAVEVILRRHRPCDDSSTCLGCGSSLVGGYPTWPCRDAAVVLDIYAPDGAS